MLNKLNYLPLQVTIVTLQINKGSRSWLHPSEGTCKRILNELPHTQFSHLSMYFPSKGYEGMALVPEKFLLYGVGVYSLLSTLLK